PEQSDQVWSRLTEEVVAHRRQDTDQRLIGKVRLRKVAPPTLLERLNLGSRLGDGGARAQLTHETHVVIVARPEAVRVHAPSTPEARFGVREIEAGRHDTDDGDFRPVD